MDISFTDDGKKGAFFIQADGDTLAEMTFVWAGKKKIIIDHTEVGEALKGRQAGKQLVQKAVEFAREKQIKILPLCPFAKRVMSLNPDYADVL
jgi:uncharacterized protein